MSQSSSNSGTSAAILPAEPSLQREYFQGEHEGIISLAASYHLSPRRHPALEFDQFMSGIVEIDNNLLNHICRGLVEFLEDLTDRIRRRRPGEMFFQPAPTVSEPEPTVFAGRAQNLRNARYAFGMLATVILYSFDEFSLRILRAMCRIEKRAW